MEKCILDDQFTLNDNKQEEIRKYGQKENSVWTHQRLHMVLLQYRQSTGIS